MPRMADGRALPDDTFAYPDLTTFTRLDELGLEVIGQRIEPDHAVLACRVVDPDDSAGSYLVSRDLTSGGRQGGAPLAGLSGLLRGWCRGPLGRS
jgi:hypothetical protein